MSGQELIDWLLGECRFRKIPPYDSAMIIILRELHDVESTVKTLKHAAAKPEEK